VAVNVTGSDRDDGGVIAADDGGGGEAATAPEESAGLLAAVELESQAGVSYDDEGVRSLAADTATALRASAEAAPDAGGDASFEDPTRAIRCLRTAGAPLDDPRDHLVRLIEAEYKRTPAYFAVFEESPGAGQPPNAVVVWGAAIDGCTLVTFVQQPL
jgi:hypothetical protein